MGRRPRPVPSKAAGAYKGRCEDAERDKAITAMLRTGTLWTSIQNTTGFSSSAVHGLTKRMKRRQCRTHDSNGIAGVHFICLHNDLLKRRNRRYCKIEAHVLFGKNDA
jgi:hypothetical protein